MPPPDPYRVWLSEVMLQQTTVSAVKPYYAKFLALWPRVEDLAAAAEEEVMAAWAGLGYYSRARNLHACARRLVAEYGGVFPDSAAALRKLPGIGDYTAAAIAAICYGEAVAVVDANVERVTARLFAVDTPLPAARKRIREKVADITPPQRVGDFAQAMMDLGATLCTARAAKCEACPLAPYCKAHKEAPQRGEPVRYPVRAPRRAKPERRGQALWVRRGDSVLLARRPGKGMLAGMMALPDDDWRAGADGAGFGAIFGSDGTGAENSADHSLSGDGRARARSLGAVSHSFTHFHLQLSLYALGGDGDEDGGEAAVEALQQQLAKAGRETRWWPVAELHQAGLASLYMKAAERAMATSEAEPSL